MLPYVTVGFYQELVACIESEKYYYRWPPRPRFKFDLFYLLCRVISRIPFRKDDFNPLPDTPFGKCTTS